MTQDYKILPLKNQFARFLNKSIGQSFAGLVIFVIFVGEYCEKYQ